MTFKALLIGDVHATVEELADCDHLMEVVDAARASEGPDEVIYLGDLYDAFAVKNVVVERWWMSRIRRHDDLLLGNHDRPGDQAAVGHALQAHAAVAMVVDEPKVVCDRVLLLPYYFRAEDFVAACNRPAYRDVQTVLCHQSFIGGKYDSGLPIELRHDPSAVDPAAIPQKCVISGHVHTPQYVARKVWYPGSPRWRNNVSDANVDRYVYLVTFEDGLPKAVKKFSTGDACRRIWRVDDVEGQPAPAIPGKTGDRVVVDVTGSATYIESRKPQWVGARIRAFSTDRPSPKLSEALGMEAAWTNWGRSYQPRYGTPLPELVEMLRERAS